MGSACPSSKLQRRSDLIGILRTHSGGTPSQATSELNQLQRSFEDQNPGWKRWSDFVTVPLRIQMTGGLRPKIILLFASVLAVLLITCANVANLVLAKSMGFAARGTLPPAEMASALQAAIAQVDSELPIADVHSMQEVVEDSTASVRFSVTLLGLFAAVAWSLALVGVYAIVSYLVNERMHEMGVRVALGAQRSNLFSLVFAVGMRFVAIGIATGVVLLLGVSRVLTHFVNQVRVVDPATYSAMILLVFFAAGLAMIIPAQKATTADPMMVLRTE
jgi:hypothetical protein